MPQLRSLDKAGRRFGEQARDLDVALFFYSGHGLQVNGINYLQPIGADIRREQDVQFLRHSIPRRFWENWRQEVNG